MNSGLLIAFLQSPFQFAERGQFAGLEFSDPPFADLMDRHRVEIVQLLAAVFEGGDQIGFFENPEVFCDGLPGHREAVAEFIQGLSAAGVKPVQQRPPGSIGERFEDLIHGRHNRQPNGCMSRGCFDKSSTLMPLSSLLPLWEKVILAQRGSDEGSLSAETDPSPVRDASASRPPSPTGGEGGNLKFREVQTRRTIAGTRSLTDGAPSWAMALRVSKRSRPSTRSTPGCPNAPRPQR